MGIEYIRHSDMCGCERCAAQWDSENPMPVYDKVDNPDILDCGCDAYYGCECAYDTEDGIDE